MVKAMASSLAMSVSFAAIVTSRHVISLSGLVTCLRCVVQGMGWIAVMQGARSSDEGGGGGSLFSLLDHQS